jgi:hypothetical protein
MRNEIEELRLEKAEIRSEAAAKDKGLVAAGPAVRELSMGLRNAVDISGGESDITPARRSKRPRLENEFFLSLDALLKQRTSSIPQ